MDFGVVLGTVPVPFKPVKYHMAVIAEFWQFVSVQHDGKLCGTNDLHIGFQNLRGIVLDEEQGLVM